jgi:uncharacterized protein YjiS (DUF1127 family)
MPSSATAPIPQASPVRRGLSLQVQAVARRVAAASRRLLAGILAMEERAASRRHLAEMDGRMLRDIGLSHSEREEELRKWFWHR